MRRYSEIGSIDFEVNFQLYRVTLYRGGAADVFAIKHRNGKPYLSTIKPTSRNHRTIMRELRKMAVRGNLLAEQLAEHDEACGPA